MPVDEQPADIIYRQHEEITDLKKQIIHQSTRAEGAELAWEIEKEGRKHDEAQYTMHSSQKFAEIQGASAEVMRRNEELTSLVTGLREEIAAMRSQGQSVVEHAEGQ